jgi:hypothetical protein
MLTTNILTIAKNAIQVANTNLCENPKTLFFWGFPATRAAPFRGSLRSVLRTAAYGGALQAAKPISVLLGQN